MAGGPAAAAAAAKKRNRERKKRRAQLSSKPQDFQVGKDADDLHVVEIYIPHI